jgi:hypothetical protein
VAIIEQTTGTPSVSTTTATSAVPSATQQTAFNTALAAAQLGATGPSGTIAATADADAKSAKHLALFSIFQQSVLRVMDDVDRNRKAASESDD